MLIDLREDVVTKSLAALLATSAIAYCTPALAQEAAPASTAGGIQGCCQSSANRSPLGRVPLIS